MASSPADDKFVGREHERQIFQDLLVNPYGNQRVLLVHGPGGIGKTRLIRRLLADAREKYPDALVLDEPIDVALTDYRHIDGLQSKIIDALSRSPKSKTVVDIFVPYHKRQTSETFHQCLRHLCQQQPVVLAFDTFEHLHNDVAGDWVLSADERDLQVPGLLCIVVGREPYPSTSLVRVHPLSGFNLQETLELFEKVAEETRGLGEVPPSSEPDTFLPESNEALNVITEGHPLLLEIAIRWMGVNLYDPDVLRSLNGKDEFEANLMREVREYGELGNLYVGALPVNRAVYDTIVCMSYLDRGFNSRMLNRLVNDGFVKLDAGTDRETQISEILRILQQYFFVKAIGAASSGYSELQLHDEMARLVQDNLWKNWDSETGKTKDEFVRKVIEWYDSLIHEAEGGK